MWNFNFNVSFTGAAIAILLFISSLFIKWIYTLNLRYKYKKYDSTINAPGIRSAKKILQDSNILPQFKINQNYFLPKANTKKKIINLEFDAFIYSTIFEQVNSVFIAFKYKLLSQSQSSYSSIYTILRIITSFLAINVLWILVFGWYGMVLVIMITLITIAIWEISSILKIDKKASRLAFEYLRINTRVDKHHIIQSYMKYKKITTIILYTKIFASPLIALYELFKDWGKDE